MTGEPVRKIRCVGAVVRDSATRLLLVRRANEPGRGLWSLPGGRVEPGETDPIALHREMIEETGLVVRIGPLIGVVERPAPDGVFVISDYACEVAGGTLAAGDDALDARFVDHATFDTFDRDGALVPQLAHTLRDWGVMPASASDGPTMPSAPTGS